MVKASHRRPSVSRKLLVITVLLVVCGAGVGIVLFSDTPLLSMFSIKPSAATSSRSVPLARLASSEGSGGTRIGSSSTSPPQPSWVDVTVLLKELEMDVIEDPSDDAVGGIGSDNPSKAVPGQCRMLQASLAGALCDDGGAAKSSPSHYTKDFMFSVVAADREGGGQSIRGSADGLLKKVVRWGEISHCAVSAPLMKRRVLCMLGVDTGSKLDGVQEAKTSWMNSACDHVTVFGKDVIRPPPSNHQIKKEQGSSKGGGPNGTTTTAPPPSDPPPTVVPKGTCFARVANHGAMRLGQMSSPSPSSPTSSFSHIHRRGEDLPTNDGASCIFPDLLEVHSIGEGADKDTSYPQLMSALGYVASMMQRFSSFSSSPSTSTIADFDYVVVINSGTVVIPENLKALLHDPYIDALHRLDAPLLLGHRMVTKEAVPLLAQAAFILNRRLITSLDASMGDIECFAQHFSGSQDLFLSRCAGGMLGAYPLSTEDAMGQQRIHQLDLDVVNNGGGAGIDWYPAYHTGRAALQKGMGGLARYTAVIANVPAGRQSIIQRLVVAEERRQLKESSQP